MNKEKIKVVNSAQEEKTYIKSCGFIAYKVELGIRYYLIIKSTFGDVGFPKGHMEEGEDELTTAKRELKEETNISVLVIDGFRRQIEFPLPKQKNSIKQTVYYLGRCTSDEIVCQECEVQEAYFLPLEEATKALTFEQTKQILLEADCYISAL